MAVLHRERQVIDKERDIREVNSGPTQLQPIRNVLQPLTVGSRYLPFTLVMVSMLGMYFTISKGNHAIGMSHGYPLFSNVPFSFFTAHSRVGFGFS